MAGVSKDAVYLCSTPRKGRRIFTTKLTKLTKKIWNSKRDRQRPIPLFCSFSS